MGRPPTPHSAVATVTAMLIAALALAAATSVVAAADQHGEKRRATTSSVATIANSVEGWSTLSSAQLEKTASGASTDSSPHKTKALPMFQNSTVSSSSGNDAHADWSVPLTLIDISLHKRPKTKEGPRTNPPPAFNYSDTSALAHLWCSNLKSVNNVSACVTSLSHTPNAQSDKLDLLCAGKMCRLACEIVHEANLVRAGRGRRRRLAGASPCVFGQESACSPEEARSTFCALHGLDDHACRHVEERKNYRVMCHKHHHSCTPIHKLCNERGNNSVSSTKEKNISKSIEDTGAEKTPDRNDIDSRLAEEAQSERLVDDEKSSRSITSESSAKGNDGDEAGSYYSAAKTVSNGKPKSERGVPDIGVDKSTSAHWEIQMPSSNKLGKTLPANDDSSDAKSSKASKALRKAKREARAQEVFRREQQEDALPLARASESEEFSSASLMVSTVSSGERSPRSASFGTSDANDDARATTVAVSHSSIFDLIGLYSSVSPNSPAANPGDKQSVEHPLIAPDGEDVAKTSSLSIRAVTPSLPVDSSDNVQATNGSNVTESSSFRPSSSNDSDSGTKSMFNDFLSWFPLSSKKEKDTANESDNRSFVALSLNSSEPREADSKPPPDSDPGLPKETFFPESGDYESISSTTSMVGENGSLALSNSSYSHFTADNSPANGGAVDGSVPGRLENDGSARNEADIAEVAGEWHYYASPPRLEANHSLPIMTDLDLGPSGSFQNQTETNATDILSVSDSQVTPTRLEPVFSSEVVDSRGPPANASSAMPAFDVSGNETVTVVSSSDSQSATKSTENTLSDATNQASNKWLSLATKNTTGKTFVKGGGSSEGADDSEKPITMSVAPLLRERASKDDATVRENGTASTATNTTQHGLSESLTRSLIDENSHSENGSAPLSVATDDTLLQEASSSSPLPSTPTTSPFEISVMEGPHVIPFASEEDLGLDIPDPGEQEHGAVTSVGLDKSASFASDIRARASVGTHEASSTPPPSVDLPQNETESAQSAQINLNSTLGGVSEIGALPYNVSAESAAAATPREMFDENATITPTLSDWPNPSTPSVPSLRSLNVNASVADDLDPADILHTSVEEQEDKHPISDPSSNSSAGSLQDLTEAGTSPSSVLIPDTAKSLEPTTPFTDSPSGNISDFSTRVMQPTSKAGDETMDQVASATSASKQAEFLLQFGQLCHVNYEHILELSSFNATANKQWIAFLVKSVNELLQEQN